MTRITAFILLLGLLCSLLLGGCAQKSNKPTLTPPADATIGTFVISSDSIQVSGGQQKMAGLATDGSASGDNKAHFADSQQKLGVFAQYGKITFSFVSELPQKITCYVNDYNGLAPSREYTVDSPTAETALYIDPIEVPSASSSVTLHSSRQVHIICHYSDRTVEYFLVLEGLSTAASA